MNERQLKIANEARELLKSNRLADHQKSKLISDVIDAFGDLAEVPATEVPATEAPAAEVPAAEVPAAEVPAAEVPAAEVPAAEVPAGGDTIDFPNR